MNARATTWKTKIWRWRSFGGVVLALLLLDQLSKLWCVGALTRAFEDPGEPLSLAAKLGRFLTEPHPEPYRVIEVIEGFWRFHYVENQGAAFSIFASTGAGWFRVPFLLLLAAAAMVFIVAYYKKLPPEQKLSRLALMMVFGGALGNFIDRARFGYVIDFVQWHINDKAHWPTFNVADAAITVGVALILLETLLAYLRERAARQRKTSGN